LISLDSRHRTRTGRRRLVAGAGFLLAALALTSCSDSSGKGPGVASLGNTSSSAPASSAGAESGSADPQDQMLKFARCMRSNGVDVPDPGGPGTGGFQIRGAGQDAAKFDSAMKACQKYLGGAMGDPNDPKIQDRKAKMDKCLRKHGLEIQDNPNGMGSIKAPREKVEQVMKVCSQEIEHP